MEWHNNPLKDHQQLFQAIIWKNFFQNIIINNKYYKHSGSFHTKKISNAKKKKKTDISP